MYLFPIMSEKIVREKNGINIQIFCVYIILSVALQ